MTRVVEQARRRFHRKVKLEATIAFDSDGRRHRNVACAGVVPESSIAQQDIRKISCEDHHWLPKDFEAGLFDSWKLDMLFLSNIGEIVARTVSFRLAPEPFSILDIMFPLLVISDQAK